MSRIGKKPIPVPSGVKINKLADGRVEVQGPKGKLNVLVPAQIKLEQKDGVLTALRQNEEHRALHGLARALLANAVHGVTQGFKRSLISSASATARSSKAKSFPSRSANRIPWNFPFPRGFRSPSISRRISSSAARTRPRSARWPRTSVRSDRPIRTSKRASASPASA